MIGGPGRSVVSSTDQRKAFLHLVYEHGFHDGYHAGLPVRCDGYKHDEEARNRYLMGLRIGKRERERDAA